VTSTRAALGRAVLGLTRLMRADLAREPSPGPKFVRAGLARANRGQGQGLGACSGWLKRSIMIDWPRKLGFLRTRRSMVDADSV
jgi:hypothetical protein